MSGDKAALEKLSEIVDRGLALKAETY